MSISNLDSKEKGVSVISKSSSILPLESNRLHFVARGEPLPEYDGVSDEQIAGYDRDLMRDRTTLTSAEERKLKRRIDWRLLPLLALMYTIKTMDAQNVANARIMDKGTQRNILTELHITSNQYNLVTVAYYIPYIVAEAPFNLLVKWVRPSVWQARITWGVVLCTYAAVKNAGGLYVVRSLLGLCEAGLWPGILLQMCYWYRPDELPKRIVLVTVAGTFSAVFSGLLAFAFNGVTTGGLSGWKLYATMRQGLSSRVQLGAFIGSHSHDIKSVSSARPQDLSLNPANLIVRLIFTEGLVTIVLGVVVFFSLPDFPEDAKWLSEKEKSFIQARLPISSPRSKEKDFDGKQFVSTLKDYKLWLFLGIWGFYTVGTTGLTSYQPTVIANLGFTSIGKAQLLNLPPAVLSSLLIVGCAWLTGTGKVPMPLIPISYMIVIEVCYIVEYLYPNTGGVYAATMLAGGFSTAWYTMMWPWRIQMIEGATGSAFAIAFANSYGQIGGAVGAQLFNSRYAPHYKTSFAIGMGLLGVSIIFALVTWYFTASIDVETRRIKRARIAASKQNQTVLDDVDLHAADKKRL